MKTAEDQHTDKLHGRQLALVGLMFGYSVMNYFDRTIMSIAGPEIMKEFNLSPTRMGSIYSAFILSYALLMIPGGHLTDRLGPRMTLTFMGSSAALFTALTALVGLPMFGTWMALFPTLILIRFGLGVASAPIYTACARMCALWIPPIHQARVQGLIIAGSSLGGAISPLVFSWLIRQYGWRISFGIAAAATAALAVVWFGYARDRASAGTLPLKVAPAVPRQTPWRKFLTNRSLLLLTFAYGTVGYFDYVFFYWIYYYFGQVRQMGFSQSARFTTILFLSMAVIMPLGGWISDRVTHSFGPSAGRRLVPLASMVLCAATLFIGTQVQNPVITLAAMSLSIGFAGFCEGPFWAAATALAGNHVGTACAILNTGGNIGGFLAPLAIPWIASFAGWSWSLHSASLLVLTGALACYFSDPRKPQYEGEVPESAPGNVATL